LLYAERVPNGIPTAAEMSETVRVDVFLGHR
jgi:hypothetical protein